MSLVIIETHPVQYHAPVYRALAQQFNLPITVIYGSDFSVIGYEDKEFQSVFSWDTDLLSGYPSIFLTNVNNGGAKSFDQVTAKGLNQVLTKVNPKAVLITGYNHRLYHTALIYSFLKKIPILLRAETTDHAVNRNLIKAWLRDRTLSFLYQNCTKLLYIGQNSYQHYQRLGVTAEKLIFSPYCVDITPFQLLPQDAEILRNNTRNNLGIQSTEIVLLFSGKITTKKAPDLLLQAVKKLPETIREKIVMIFLGNGELREQLEIDAQNEPEIKTHFLGFQNQTKLSQYYHAADLMILPSRYGETWGLVVNESLHHGLPCIVSQAVGSAKDLIISGVTGEIFETNSIDSLCDTIQRCLILCDRPDIRAKCQEQINNYTIEKAAQGIAKAYNDMI